MIDIETNADWKAAQAEFQAACIVADKAGDELGRARAELHWVRKDNELRNKMAAEEVKQQTREAAIARVKEDFPLVPPSMYEAITDPEQLVKVAEDIQKTLDAQVKRNTNSWGGASGAPGGSSGKPPKKKSEDTKYVDDLVARVNRNEGGKLGAVKEYKDMVWRDRVTPFRDRLNGGNR